MVYTAPTGTTTGGPLPPAGRASATPNTVPIGPDTDLITARLRHMEGVGLALVTDLPAAGGATTYVTATGLTADGTLGGAGTDQTAALNAYLRDPNNSGKSLIIPSGTYRVDGVLGGSGASRIVDNLTVLAGNKQGTGRVVLVATTPASCAYRVDGVAGHKLIGVTLEAANVTARLDGWTAYRLSVTTSTDFTATRVRVGGGPAAGIYLWNVDGFLLDRPTVDSTKADGIHLTGGTRNGVVIDPVVTGSADDQLAVVDYEADVATYGHCRNISVHRPFLDGQSYGRGLALLGGADIDVYDIEVKNTTHAGLYAGCEQPAAFWKPNTAYAAGASVMPSAAKSNGNYYTTSAAGTSGSVEPTWGATGTTADNGMTWTPSNGYLTSPSNGVRVFGGTIIRANTNTAVDHGAISLQSQRTDAPNVGLEVRNIDVIDPAPGHPSAVVNLKGVGWVLPAQSTTVDGIVIRGVHNPSYPWSIDGVSTLAAAATAGIALTQPVEAPDGGEHSTRTITGATTLSVTDDVVFCGGTTSYTVTLPAAAVSNGTTSTSKPVTLLNTGTGTVTVSGPAGSPTIAPAAAAAFVADGTSWRPFSNVSTGTTTTATDPTRTLAAAGGTADDTAAIVGARDTWLGSLDGGTYPTTDLVLRTGNYTVTTAGALLDSPRNGTAVRIRGAHVRGAGRGSRVTFAKTATSAPTNPYDNALVVAGNRLVGARFDGFCIDSGESTPAATASAQEGFKTGFYLYCDVASGSKYGSVFGTGAQNDIVFRDVTLLGVWQRGWAIDGGASANLNSEIVWDKCYLATSCRFTDAAFVFGLAPITSQGDQFLNYHWRDCMVEINSGNVISAPRGGFFMVTGGSWIIGAGSGTSGDAAATGAAFYLPAGGVSHANDVKHLDVRGTRFEFRSNACQLLKTQSGTGGWGGGNSFVRFDNVTVASNTLTSTPQYQLGYQHTGDGTWVFENCELPGYWMVDQATSTTNGNGSIVFRNCRFRDWPTQAVNTTAGDGTGFLRWNSGGVPKYRFENCPGITTGVLTNIT